MSKEADERDQFSLYDLEVVVESIEGNCTCDMSIGDSFQLQGGKLAIPDRSYCLYALQSVIPLLPAKQFTFVTRSHFFPRRTSHF